MLSNNKNIFTCRSLEGKELFCSVQIILVLFTLILWDILTIDKLRWEYFKYSSAFYALIFRWCWLEIKEPARRTKLCKSYTWSEIRHHIKHDVNFFVKRVSSLVKWSNFSLSPQRPRFGQSWTLPWAMTSSREIRPPFPRLRANNGAWESA